MLCYTTYMLRTIRNKAKAFRKNTMGTTGNKGNVIKRITNQTVQINKFFSNKIETEEVKPFF